jgi:hypothetical protein
MSKFYKFSVTIIIGILILVVSSFSQVSEKKTDSNLSTTQGYNCKAMQKLFLDALVSANKPGGLITTRNSCPENVVFPEYEPEELYLDERLNLITQMNPNYKWKDEQGVINLAPTKFTPKLFNVKIRNVKVMFDTNLNLALSEILGLPEVVEKLKELNLRRGLQFGGLQSPPSNRLPTEMIFKNKTLQQILNEIVKKRGRGIWVYSESHFNGTDTFSLEFLVQ